MLRRLWRTLFPAPAFEPRRTLHGDQEPAHNVASTAWLRDTLKTHPGLALMQAQLNTLTDAGRDEIVAWASDALLGILRSGYSVRGEGSAYICPDEGRAQETERLWHMASDALRSHAGMRSRNERWLSRLEPWTHPGRATWGRSPSTGMLERCVLLYTYHCPSLSLEELERLYHDWKVNASVCRAVVRHPNARYPLIRAVARGIGGGRDARVQLVLLDQEEVKHDPAAFEALCFWARPGPLAKACEVAPLETLPHVFSKLLHQDVGRALFAIEMLDEKRRRRIAQTCGAEMLASESRDVRTVALRLMGEIRDVPLECAGKS